MTLKLHASNDLIGQLKPDEFRYLTARHTKRWIDVLDAFIASYNKSFHRTIGMTPDEVTLDNSQQIAVTTLYLVNCSV